MAFPGRDAADHTNESSICKRPEMARFYAGSARSRGTETTIAGASVGSPVVDHDDAMQTAALGRLVPLAGAVHAATIVGHQHISRLPAMLVGEAVLDHVLQQLAVERLGFAGLHAVDAGAPFASQVQSAPGQLGMRADPRMNDVGDLAPFRLHLL